MLVVGTYLFSFGCVSALVDHLGSDTAGSLHVGVLSMQTCRGRSLSTRVAVPVELSSSRPFLNP